MKNSSNFKATIFCLLFLLLNAVQSVAQMRYQYGQSQFTISHATGAPNLHIVYNKPFSTTFPSPPTVPDFRIEAIIGSVSHKWDLDASGTLSFKYGSGSTTANMMSLNGSGLSVTGKDFSLGGRIEMGEAVTPNNQTGHYLAFGGRNIAANGWQFSGTNGGAVIQGDNQGNLYFITHTGSSMLTPANIGQSIKMHLSPDALVLNGRDLEIKDQSGDKQFKIGTSGEVTARKVSVITGLIPDYVFKEDYDLLTIDEVETFINEYGHLPKIKSAAEYETIGTVDLGELNLQLLEKVEELTLYTIEQQKQLELLKKELKNLSTKINQNE